MWNKMTISEGLLLVLALLALAIAWRKGTPARALNFQPYGSLPAYGSSVVLYERTTTVYRLTVPTLKPLPEGYHHWREVPQELQTPALADGSVVCNSLTAAIAYAKRLAMGYGPSEAVRVMAAAWGGTAVCGFTTGFRLIPELYARRGDDQGGNGWKS